VIVITNLLMALWFLYVPPPVTLHNPIFCPHCLWVSCESQNKLQSFRKCCNTIHCLLCAIRTDCCILSG